MEKRNLIFLTMARTTNVSSRGIYTDLLRKFRNEGFNVYIVAPNERREKRPTQLVEIEGVHVLNVRTLNLQKTSLVEKGVGQVLIEGQYKRAIRKYLKDIRFDLILYSTPPITFPNVIRYLKEKNPDAKTYLLLKDIFPQNAVDMGMISKTGLKGWLYKFFRNKEKKLYAESDYIGCMSPANVNYLLKHNPEIALEKVEVAPNSIELSSPQDTTLTEKDYCLKEKNERYYIRKKYDIPVDRPIFIYGGNLGKPQGIDYLIKCLDENKKRNDCFFVVIGSGTEYPKLAEWKEKNNTACVKVMKSLPKDEYDIMVKSCDVGLIFLDHRFTIPNFPSRLLSYLEYEMPVLCATDVNSDMGKIAEENGFGYWCESVNPTDFTLLVNKILSSDIKQMGNKGFRFLRENYLVDNTYTIIMNRITK